MSLLYVVVLAVIVVVLLAVALYRSSQVKTKADYLVAGRSLPAVVLVLTPSMDLLRKLVSSTNTPGARYSGMFLMI